MARKAATTTSPHRRSIIGDRYRLEGTYERLRRALLEAPNDGRLDKSLSYWVLPTDRRLPIAFLDRNLRELLDLPLEDLMNTQGVGHKKILGFFDLLRRAHKTQTPHEPFGSPGSSSSASPRSGDTFDPTSISEAVWSDWCETIMHAGLGRLLLGRVAPSLKPLPTVIWEKSLKDYAGKPLTEIRQMKTHGEKRVNAILEVFGVVHEAVSTSVLHEAIEIELSPRFVPAMRQWLIEMNPQPEAVTLKGLQKNLVAPLVRQIDCDLGELVAGLLAERLTTERRAPTVTQQAERIGVTRARVYQLLDDCSKTLAVRWPEGRWMLAPLAAKPAETAPEVLGLIHQIRTLFYPE